MALPPWFHPSAAPDVKDFTLARDASGVRHITSRECFTFVTDPRASSIRSVSLVVKGKETPHRLAQYSMRSTGRAAFSAGVSGFPC